MAYKIDNFLLNVERRVIEIKNQKERVQKNELISEIVASLKKPFEDLMSIVGTLTEEEYEKFKKIEEDSLLYNHIMNLSNGKRDT